MRLQGPQHAPEEIALEGMTIRRGPFDSHQDRIERCCAWRHRLQRDGTMHGLRGTGLLTRSCRNTAPDVEHIHWRIRRYSYAAIKPAEAP
jgi:hypothetical protein